MGRGGGWYTDPYGVGTQQRWWDGTKWTKELRPATASSSPAPPPAREFESDLLIDRPESVLNLAFSLDARAWELRRGHDVVGVIALKQGEIDGGGRSWTVSATRHRRCVVFEPLAAGDATAAFYPRGLRLGGTLVLADERWYRLREVWQDDWLLVDQDGHQIFQYR